MKLQIFRPLISNKLNQKFGENKPCKHKKTGKIVNKVQGVCPIGTEDFYKSIGMDGHSGLDLSAWSGEPIFHAGNFDGWMRTEKDSAGGIGVDVISNEKIELADGTKSYVKLRYWHLKAPIGHDGKQVTIGMPIGLADNTGASSGDHLHFGLKKCDKNGRPTERNNGYYGAIDPMPYCNFSIDAKTHSIFMNIPPAPLSEQEEKEFKSQLTIWAQILILWAEIRRRV